MEKYEDIKREARRVAARQAIRSFYATTILLFIVVAILIACLSAPKEKEKEEPEAEPVNYESTVSEVHPEEAESIVYYDVPLDGETQDYIRMTAGYYSVPMPLVMAIIQCESGFKSDAISPTHDYGLMQINQCNLSWLTDELGVTDILDPRQNVLCGIHLISGHLSDSDGNVEEALLKYNCGRSGAKKLMSQGIYRTYYTEKIMSAYETFLEEEQKKSTAGTNDNAPYER